MEYQVGQILIIGDMKTVVHWVDDDCQILVAECVDGPNSGRWYSVATEAFNAKHSREEILSLIDAAKERANRE